MTPTRPYLLRAVYQWIVDNGCTPYLVVDAGADGVDVPRQFVEDGRIILNVSPSAAHGLEMPNEGVYFSARFSGTPCEVRVPMPAVQAIYARENGRGMVFTAEEPDGTPPQGPGGDDDKPRRPSLKVVK